MGDEVPIVAQGEVRIDEPITLPGGARLRIVLRDISLAGGAAVELDRRDFDVPETPQAAPLAQAFLLEGRGADWGRYQVWATLDLTGDGRLSPGDWFSALSPTVEAGRPERSLIITLVQVPLIP